MKKVGQDEGEFFETMAAKFVASREGPSEEVDVSRIEASTWGMNRISLELTIA